MDTTVTLGMVLEARERLKKVVRRTDLVPYRVLGVPGKNEIFIKTENLQHTGAFKLRGAYNKIAQLTEEERAHGVIASSAGNHAQGVALAASMFGVKATIVMPEGAPLAKIAATRAYGAEVVLSGLVYDDAYQKAMELQQETGAVFVHPFNDPQVIAGQGSLGLEIMDDEPDIGTVVVPIGGGGLISGIAVAIKSLWPNVKIIGVQAAGAPSMQQSLREGHPITLSSAHTIADGIAVKTPGDLTYELCQKYVDEVVTVDEDEICNAILTLLEKCKIVAEGAGAVSVAALLHNKFKAEGKIACLVSGGNIDVTTLQRILDKGLMKAGRLAQVCTLIEDRPGRLHRLLAVVSDSGANVVSIRHDRTNMESGIGMAMLELTLETHNQQHLDQVLATMEQNGYRIISH
ncbi:MAG TPA: threonine ammonia-lyase [Candidatus Faecaligallichristensenella faecipullorum]|nr:threonine ammonia-lyase [Candidatus Faecaligallichristensenella faecipullorum]